MKLDRSDEHQPGNVDVDSIASSSRRRATAVFVRASTALAMSISRCYRAKLDRMMSISRYYRIKLDYGVSISLFKHVKLDLDNEHQLLITYKAL